MIIDDRQFKFLAKRTFVFLNFVYAHFDGPWNSSH